MKQNFFSQLTGSVKLTDRDFIGKGGQASVYVHRGYALKVFHTMQQMIPEAKLRELSRLNIPNVLKPKDILYTSRNKPAGYVMDHCRHGEPLCRLFTKTFKQQHGIMPQDVVELVRAIHEMLVRIHAHGFLVVDLNEFNILVTDNWRKPVFIDVDSYQTPTHQANAILESIRDPLAGQDFTELSDWYSFAILSFQLYIGIHPFKGKHPNFPKGDLCTRMEQGASVLDPDVRLPAACNDFSVIPKAQLSWFREIFSNRDRSIPPLPGSICVGVPQPVIVQSKGYYEVRQVFEIAEPIQRVFQNMGSTYALSANGIWSGSRRVAARQFERESLLFAGPTPLICAFDRGALTFRQIGGAKVQRDSAERVLFAPHTVCSILEGSLFQHNAMEVGHRAVVGKRKLCSLISNQTRIFDGLLVQESLDRTILIYPYDTGRCVVRAIPELDGARIIDARARGNIVAFLVQNGEQTDRLMLIFSGNMQSYKLRVVEDIDELNLNFAVLPNGICVFSVSDHAVEIFRNVTRINSMQNPPFTPATPLYATNAGMHFISGNAAYHATIRS